MKRLMALSLGMALEVEAHLFARPISAKARAFGYGIMTRSVCTYQLARSPSRSRVPRLPMLTLLHPYSPFMTFASSTLAGETKEFVTTP